MTTFNKKDELRSRQVEIIEKYRNVLESDSVLPPLYDGNYVYVKNEKQKDKFNKLGVDIADDTVLVIDEIDNVVNPDNNEHHSNKFSDLERQATNLSKKAGRISKVIKFISGILSLSMLGMTIAISAILLINQDNSNTYFIAGILGIVCTTIESIRLGSRLEERSKTMETIKYSAISIARKTRGLVLSNLSIENIDKQLNILWDKYINLKLSLYETTIVSGNISADYTAKMEKQYENEGEEYK